MSLDTRELEERIVELEDELEAIQDEDEDADLDKDERDELDELLALREEVSEWHYGETLIEERDFQDYARQQAEDMLGSEAFSQWPFTCIDWEKAADDLSSDYSTVTYKGTDYYVRA